MSDLSSPRFMFPDSATSSSSFLSSDANPSERIRLCSRPRLIEVEFPFGDPSEQCLTDACERTPLYLPILGVKGPKDLMAVAPKL